MKSSVIKTISLALLCAASLSPATAADTAVVNPQSLAYATANPAASTLKTQPTAELARYNWINKHKEAEDFHLLTPYKADKSIGIVALRQYGTTKGFVDFIPTHVNNAYAATDFLNKALPSFEKGQNAAIKPKMINAMDNFLTIKSANLRDALEIERAINLRATYEIANAHSSDANANTVEYWMNHFSDKHGALAANATVKATLNTRATAAALAVVAIKGAADTMQTQIQAIQTASAMKMGMLKNFIGEINKHTNGKLAKVLAVANENKEDAGGARRPSIVAEDNQSGKGLAQAQLAQQKADLIQYISKVGNALRIPNNGAKAEMGSIDHTPAQVAALVVTKVITQEQGPLLIQLMRDNAPLAANVAQISLQKTSHIQNALSEVNLQAKLDAVERRATASIHKVWNAFGSVAAFAKGAVSALQGNGDAALGSVQANNADGDDAAAT